MSVAHQVPGELELALQLGVSGELHLVALRRQRLDAASSGP